MYSIRNPNGQLRFGVLKTSFNGQVLDDVLSNNQSSFKTISVRGREILNKEHQTVSVPGRHGAYFYNGIYGSREIKVSFLIQAKDRKSLLDRYGQISQCLRTKTPQLLSFSDDPHRFYFAQFKDMSDLDEKRDDAMFSLTFICYDPFKYSDVKPVSGNRITYAGDEDTKPILTITLTASGNELRVLHLEKQQYIRLKGTYTAGNKIVIDMKKRTITQNGRSILTDLDVVNSRFFTFSKGVNTLSINLGHTVTSEFREVYL
ncbi:MULTISPECIES: distal tail protein Dit [unclassified Streptococcus]|uniref:distal tail protein Dit n=1 Tax=unclassified Streptococcus TaxID=2608887 RepID=UPI00211B7191|nr:MULTISPECIES: distal tail protein Dit [unclassified Streptococcus]MCQ9212844.1 phage tail family protein [Streptococcus sp. B01]MCQ9212933.1 phage tail family protein [Streptococcus sp. O1]MCQ9215009.1 phage tail family protein [Streptococcus sp. O1]